MTQRKLKPVKYYHRQSTDNAMKENSGKDAILICFNRPLHPLEAMGIFHLISEEMKGN